MPTATYIYNGHSATLEWPEGAPQDQINAMATHARGLLEAKYGAAPDGDSPGNPGSNSFGAALETGLGNAASGLVNVAGDAAGALGYSGAASALRNLSAANQNAGDFNGHPIDTLRKSLGNVVAGRLIYKSLSNAAGAAGNLVALQAPTIATALGTGALTGGAGTAAYLGANAAGNTIEQRMMQQGEAAPSAADYTAGAVNGAVQGGLGAFGLGKMGAAAIPGIASGNALIRTAAGAGLDAAASGVGGVANQIATGAGTPGGVDIEPGQIEASAAEGGLVRLTPGMRLAAPEAAPDLVHNASIARVGNMLAHADAQIAAVRGGQKAAPTQVVNSVFQQLRGQLQASSSALVEHGLMTRGQKTAIFDPLLNQAASHKSGMGATIGDMPDGAAATALDQFRALNLPPEVANPVADGLHDLDTLSQNKLYKQGSGPFARIGHYAGEAAGGMLPTMLGVPHSAGGLVEDMFGYKLGGKIGHRIGAGLDSALGTTTPPIVAQVRDAQAVLAKHGVSPGPNSLKQLQQLQDTLTEQAAASAPVSSPGSAAQYSNMAATARRYGPDDPVGTAALTALRASGNDQMADDAVAHWNALAPIRTAQAKAAQAAASNRAQTSVEDAAATDQAEIAARAAQTRGVAGGMSPQVPPAGSGPASGAGAASPPPFSASSTGASVPTDALGHPIGSLGNVLAQGPITRGVELTPGDLASSLDSMVADGSIHPAYGAYLKNSLGSPLNNAGGQHDPVLTALLGRALASKGADIPHDYAAAVGRGSGNGAVPNGGGNPVQNAYQFGTAANAFHDTVNQTIAAATRNGDEPLAQFILAIKNQKSVSAKRAAWTAFAKTHPNSAQLGGQLGVLSLIEHGKPQTK